MKKTRILPILTVFLAVLAVTATSAKANPKFNSLWWWSSHWESQNFEPYYDNGTDPHNTQWTGRSDWKPQDWITMNQTSGNELINRWYTANIIKKQYYKDGIPYLDVGANFYHLSGQDKRRVMDMVNHVYQITTKSPRIFYLNDPQTDKLIGYYGTDGLILQ